MSDALCAPMGELISSIGLGVAQAQREMDIAALATLRDIATSDSDMAGLMRSIGYRPTWYQIPEAEAEIQIALSISGSEESSGKPTVYAAPVDATYTNKFNWNLSASSKLRFRIVPVPPSVQAEALVVVPALSGFTVDKARRLLLAMGVPFEVPDGTADTAIIDAQLPEAGAFLTQGAVTVQLARTIKSGTPAGTTVVAATPGTVRGAP